MIITKGLGSNQLITRGYVFKSGVLYIYVQTGNILTFRDVFDLLYVRANNDSLNFKGVSDLISEKNIINNFFYDLNDEVNSISNIVILEEAPQTVLDARGIEDKTFTIETDNVSKRKDVDSMRGDR